jgi:hypothetical protein
MEHLSEEQLILHYYDEADDASGAGAHLETCGQCRARYASIQRVLNSAGGLVVPERGEEYGAEVWQRLAPRLPRRRWLWRPWGPAWRWAAAGAAMLVLVSAGFLAGRYAWRPTPPVAAASDPQVRERVLLAAVGDCLERSELVLAELANAGEAGPRNISSEQARAATLINETRLYRQTAAAAGNIPVADLLDDVERLLLDVARGPSDLSPEQVQGLRRRLDAEGIVFKIRVVNSNVRTRQTL